MIEKYQSAFLKEMNTPNDSLKYSKILLLINSMSKNLSQSKIESLFFSKITIKKKISILNDLIENIIEHNLLKDASNLNSLTNVVSPEILSILNSFYSSAKRQNTETDLENNYVQNDSRDFSSRSVDGIDVDDSTDQINDNYDQNKDENQSTSNNSNIINNSFDFYKATNSNNPNLFNMNPFFLIKNSLKNVNN